MLIIHVYNNSDFRYAITYIKWTFLSFSILSQVRVPKIFLPNANFKNCIENGRSWNHERGFVYVFTMKVQAYSQFVFKGKFIGGACWVHILRWLGRLYWTFPWRYNPWKYCSPAKTLISYVESAFLIKINKKRILKSTLAWWYVQNCLYSLP